MNDEQQNTNELNMVAQDGVLPLQTISALLAELRLTAVAKLTGVSYPTLQKLADGDHESNYQLTTLRAISTYLLRRYGGRV